MSADLHQLLEDAAARAPVPNAEAVWQAGRRRARRRTVVTGAATAIGLLAVVLTATLLQRPGTSTIGPVGPPGIDERPNSGPPAPAGLVEVATLVDDGTVLLRPDGTRQDLPALAVDEAVMLRDGTFVYEAYPPGASLVGDPPLWAMPPRGAPVLLDPATDRAGERQLVGRDETGELAMVLVEGGELEVWGVDGVRVPVGAVPHGVTAAGDVEVSRGGPSLAARNADGSGIVVSTVTSGSQTQVVHPAGTDGRVLDLAHTGTALLALVHDQAAGPAVVELDPATGQEGARHEVPLGDRADETVGMSVTDGHVAVHRRRSGRWAPSALLTLASGAWATADRDGPAWLVGPPTPPMEARPAVPSATTTTLVPDRPGGLIGRAVAREDGRRQAFPVGALLPAVVVLDDGTVVFEANDPEAGVPLGGQDAALWAVPPRGDPVRLDVAREPSGSRRLVGRTADGRGILVLVDGTEVQRWTVAGDRETVDSLDGLPLSSTALVGRHVVRVVDGALATAAGGTRIVVRPPGATNADARQLAVTRDDQTIRGLAGVGPSIAVLVDDGAGGGSGELVLVSPQSMDVLGRYEIPVPDASAVGVTAHDGRVAVHLQRSGPGDGRGWLGSQLFETESTSWTLLPAAAALPDGRGPSVPHD